MGLFVGVFRLGADVREVATQNGAFGALSLAANYYDSQTKNTPTKGRETQWVHANVGGKTFEAMKAYLKKGALVEASISDLHVRSFKKNDGSDGIELTGRIVTLNFAGGRNENGNHGDAPAQGAASAPAGAHRANVPAARAPATQAPAATAPPAAAQDDGFQDDDIPFDEGQP